MNLYFDKYWYNMFGTRRLAEYVQSFRCDPGYICTLRKGRNWNIFDIGNTHVAFNGLTDHIIDLTDIPKKRKAKNYVPLHAEMYITPNQFTVIYPPKDNIERYISLIEGNPQGEIRFVIQRPKHICISHMYARYYGVLDTPCGMCQFPDEWCNHQNYIIKRVSDIKSNTEFKELPGMYFSIIGDSNSVYALEFDCKTKKVVIRDGVALFIVKNIPRDPTKLPKGHYSFDLSQNSAVIKPTPE